MVRQTNKEKLSITLDVEVFEFVSAEAVKDDRSVSSMINVILRNYMNEKKKD
ncbi:hypothetical protein NYE44_01515 [Paenibacillus sp. FSL L8-0493]|jgi:hypothetical protein|uniref:hypothetical protein n=1 Tax=Paenibacillus sp. FSL L8-0493 TaxID=2975333 RepID=UPI000FBEACAB